MMLRSAGVEIHTLSDRQVYKKGDDWTKLIVAMAVMARAHEESAIKGERIKKASLKRQKDKAAHKTPHVPFWFEKGEDDLIILEDRVAELRKIFDLYLSGIGSRRIAQQMNKEGCKGPTGKGWSQSYVNILASQKTPIGTHITEDGREIEGYYPQVIDTDTWLKVQAAKKRNRVNRGTHKNGRLGLVPNLFTGIAFCGECGSPMRFDHVYNKKRVMYRYLGCADAVTGLEKEKRCKNKAHKYDFLEPFILKGLRH